VTIPDSLLGIFESEKRKYFIDEARYEVVGDSSSQSSFFVPMQGRVSYLDSIIVLMPHIDSFIPVFEAI
jgi:hypothetical protein